jgi:putative transposase
MTAVEQLAPIVGVVAACVTLAVARATFYRQKRPAPQQPSVTIPKERPRNARRYSDEERGEILAVLNSEPFMDKSPEQIFAILAEQGKYVASARTMYRVLAENDQVGERRARRQHPVHAIPRVVARGPNQVWSWDITKLKGPQKGVYYMLYVVLDIFSRYVVGWMLAEKENASLAKRLLRETMSKYGIEPGQLTVHQDRGSPMRAQTTRDMLDDLGATRSYSRPRVSNDNPFSESHFGTLKQRPELPDRLGSLEHGRQVLRPILQWYNEEHHHSGLRLLTPAQVHYGQAEEVLARRHAVRMTAYDAHPERFINGPPQLEVLKSEVWINKPDDDSSDEAMPSIANSSQSAETVGGVKAREATAKPPGLYAAERVGESSTEVVLIH